MTIEYKKNIALDAQAVANLYKSAGLRRPSDDIPRIKRMIENANLIITAWEGDTLVGIARSLTDYSFCCYLSDLAVDKAYQKKGIGKELVRQTQNAIGEECMLLLCSVPEAMGYYPKIGFEKMDKAWIINRKR